MEEAGCPKGFGVSLVIPNQKDYYQSSPSRRTLMCCLPAAVCGCAEPVRANSNMISCLRFQITECKDIAKYKCDFRASRAQK